MKNTSKTQSTSLRSRFFLLRMNSNTVLIQNPYPNLVYIVDKVVLLEKVYGVVIYDEMNLRCQRINKKKKQSTVVPYPFIFKVRSSEQSV